MRDRFATKRIEDVTKPLKTAKLFPSRFTAAEHA